MSNLPKSSSRCGGKDARRSGWITAEVGYFDFTSCGGWKRGSLLLDFTVFDRIYSSVVFHSLSKPNPLRYYQM